jgi:hypothetical protein
VIIAPLLKPISDQLGIDPVHLAIIFIVNLEIGYLTPPIGINLFVASSAFRKPLGEVIRSVVPYIMIMLVGLAVVTYVPTLSVGPVNVILRGEPFYEPLPEIDESGRVIQPGEGDRTVVEVKKAGEVNEKGVRVLSMEEMTEISEQMYVLCDAAETVVDEALPAVERVPRWKKEIAKEEVANAEVMKIVAMIEAGGPEAYAKVSTEAAALMKAEWSCEALETMLKLEGGAAKGEGDAKADGEG